MKPRLPKRVTPHVTETTRDADNLKKHTFSNRFHVLELCPCISSCHVGAAGSETDSAYVRVPRQRVRPELLKCYTPLTMKSSPAGCAALDWYLHCSNPPAPNKPWSCVSSLPDYMIHREFKADNRHGNSYETRRGPSDFDMKSVWQWHAKENTKKIKEKIYRPVQRKSEALSFSNLISNSYGIDWFQQHTGWEDKVQETSENSEQTKDSEPSQSESAPASDELRPLYQGWDK